MSGTAGALGVLGMPEVLAEPVPVTEAGDVGLPGAGGTVGAVAVPPSAPRTSVVVADWPAAVAVATATPVQGAAVVNSASRVGVLATAEACPTQLPTVTVNWTVAWAGKPVASNDAFIPFSASTDSCGAAGTAHAGPATST